MVVSPLSTTKNRIKSSLYLPSVGLGFLLVKIGPQATPKWTLAGKSINIYFWSCILTLISAVIWHEFIESYSGPSTGLLDRVPEDKIYQSIGHTLYKTGNPDQYPESPDVPPWEMEVDIPWWRYPIVSISLLLFLVLVVAYPVTIFLLGSYAIENSSLPSGAIVFASAVLVLRIIFASFWPDTYLYWSEDDTSNSE